VLATIDRKCPGADSNRDAFRHHPLKMACLPISPPGPDERLLQRSACSCQLLENRNSCTTSDSNRFHCELSNTGATGLEPATSRVTVECSNQIELRPQRTVERWNGGTVERSYD